MSDDRQRAAATPELRPLQRVRTRAEVPRDIASWIRFRHVVDRDVHRLMAGMLDGARFEALAAVGFVSPRR